VAKSTGLICFVSAKVSLVVSIVSLAGQLTGSSETLLFCSVLTISRWIGPLGGLQCAGFYNNLLYYRNTTTCRIYDKTQNVMHTLWVPWRRWPSFKTLWHSGARADKPRVRT